MTPVRHGHYDVSYGVSDRHKRDGLLQLSEDVWQKGWRDGYERFVQVYDRLLDSRLGPAESAELIRAIGENSDDPHGPDPRPGHSGPGRQADQHL